MFIKKDIVELDLRDGLQVDLSRGLIEGDAAAVFDIG
jgi:hypothetical protein